MPEQNGVLPRQKFHGEAFAFSSCDRSLVGPVTRAMVGFHRARVLLVVPVVVSWMGRDGVEVSEDLSGQLVLRMDGSVRGRMPREMLMLTRTLREHFPVATSGVCRPGKIRLKDEEFLIAEKIHAIKPDKANGNFTI